MDKQKLFTIGALLAVVIGVALLMVVKAPSNGPTAGTTPTRAAQRPGPGGNTPPGAGNGPSEPGNGPSGPGMPGAAPATPPKPAAQPATPPPDPMAELTKRYGDGKTIVKGDPVEPYSTDPFITHAKPIALPPLTVLPPVIPVIEPPKPLMVQNPVNIIPPGGGPVEEATTVGAQKISGRLSGVLWNGEVVAIMESTDTGQRRAWIVKPGEVISLPGMNLVVQSLTREQMTLVPQDGGKPIVIDLKPMPRTGGGTGMAPGASGSGSGMPGAPGMPPGAPGYPGYPGGP